MVNFRPTTGERRGNADSEHGEEAVTMAKKSKKSKKDKKKSKKK